MVFLHVDMAMETMNRVLLGHVALVCLACFAAPASRADGETGLDLYSQGGVVVDGVAYFTANDDSRRKGVERTEAYPCVVAFDAETHQRIRTYDFEFTYDSSPLVVQNGKGTWLVIAHEHKRARTVALQRDGGKLCWMSEANQPGSYFFGYSYYDRKDGSKLILMACGNGLHALSVETGEDVWWVRRNATGGVTPCVDQQAGAIFYQCDGKVLKLRADDGQVLAEIDVPSPNTCISWNTVLVDDAHGKFVATRWYGRPEWDSAIRVYDHALNLVWEKTGLPNGKKDTLTYVDGKLICGSGNGWSKKYTGDEWKYLAAYDIADGRIVWKCDLSDYEYSGILNVPCLGGYLYAETGTSPPITSHCFRINATTGKLEEVYDYGRAVTSCATHIIAHGKIFSGDLWEDRIVVTQIAKNCNATWPGPFGDPQKHHMVAITETEAVRVPMKEIGRPEPPAAVANLASAAKITARSRIGDEQADAGRINDGDPERWWSSGPGDLAIDPIDVDVRFEKPHVVDAVLLTTSALKGQLRLKAFDLFAGRDGHWDGARPLAEVRENAEKIIRVTFPPVRLDCLRIRVLGSHRPDNAFAHIAELAVEEAEGPPERDIEVSAFQPTPADAGHAPERVRSVIAALTAVADESPLAKRRIDLLKERLRLIEESKDYEEILERITRETEQYRRLDPPPWALAQRDCMARLRNWVYYWIDHQQPDGQFGGQYEDDVELTCGWPLLALAQDDRRVRDSLALLAEGVWHSRPFLERFGYDRLTDVEHAAENTSYSQPRMVVLDSENPLWCERCRRTVATMAEHFLVRNDRGLLQFPSDFFGFDPTTLEPVTRQDERPFDIPQSAKALKPAMYAVWSTGDETSRRTMLDYGRTWVAAAADADGPDRIAGMLPTQILWPSGRPAGTHAHLSSMRATLFHLIGCYYASGDKQYLEPVRTLLEKALHEWAVGDIPSAGSLDKVNEEDLSGPLEQLALVAILYRRATGDARFDPALARWAARIRGSLVEGVKSYVYLDRSSDGLWYVDRPLTVGAYLESRCAVGSQLYLGWLVTGDDDYLARVGWNLTSCLNDKWGAFTYWFYDKLEHRVTSNDHLAHKIQNAESALALMYLGGPGTIEANWPQFAVTWQNTGENFCALVRQNDSRNLLVHLYCFDEKPRRVSANLWELEPGTYDVDVAVATGDSSPPIAQNQRLRLEVPPRVDTRAAAKLEFSLPARKLTVLTIRRQP